MVADKDLFCFLLSKDFNLVIVKIEVSKRLLLVGVATSQLYSESLFYEGFQIYVY